MLWVLVVLALVTPVLALPTSAAERVKVGVLKLTSSAPIFIRVEKGFFREFGVEPELVYFQAAAPIAPALAAGQVEVGATGLTAALYNIVLGGEKLWIGVTQLGSTFHYQMGNILERHGLQLSDVRIVPLQAWVKHGFLKSSIPLTDIVDTSFVEAAAAVKE